MLIIYNFFCLTFWSLLCLDANEKAFICGDYYSSSLLPLPFSSFSSDIGIVLLSSLYVWSFILSTYDISLHVMCETEGISFIKSYLVDHIGNMCIPIPLCGQIPSLEICDIIWGTFTDIVRVVYTDNFSQCPCEKLCALYMVTC